MKDCSALCTQKNVKSQTFGLLLDTFTVIYWCQPQEAGNYRLCSVCNFTLHKLSCNNSRKKVSMSVFNSVTCKMGIVYTTTNYTFSGSQTFFSNNTCIEKFFGWIFLNPIHSSLAECFEMAQASVSFVLSSNGWCTGS